MVRALIVLVFSGVLLIVLRAMSPLLVPLLQAAFIGVISLQPLSWMRRHGVPRLPAVLVVILGVTSGIGAIATVIALSLGDVRSRFPLYQARFNGLVDEVVGYLARFQIEVPAQRIEEWLDVSSLLRFTAQAAQEVGGTLARGLFVILLVFFALMEADRQPGILRIVSANAKSYLAQIELFARQINRYLLIKTWISVGTGIAAGTLLALIGVEHALLWGVITFALNFIPTIGSIIAAIPPVVVALLVLGWFEALLVIILYVLVNILFANLLEPKFLSEGLGMSPVIILVSLATWGWVFGITGVFLAVPLAMMLRAILESSAETRWLVIFLGLRKAAREPVRETAVEARA